VLCKLYLDNLLMKTNQWTWDHYYSPFPFFLVLRIEPRTLHMLGKYMLYHWPTSPAHSPFLYHEVSTASVDPAIRPGRCWSCCGARHLEAMADWIFNFPHMFTYVQESSRWSGSKLGQQSTDK
jgi:hypothetical protein